MPKRQTVAPTVGSWGWAIFFFGWLGGVVGYFSLKSDDPRRANHVIKWGFIMSGIWAVFWIVVSIIVSVGAANSGY